MKSEGEGISILILGEREELRLSSFSPLQVEVCLPPLELVPEIGPSFSSKYFARFSSFIASASLFGVRGVFWLLSSPESLSPNPF